MNPQQFEIDLAGLVEGYARDLTSNQIITGLEHALDEALVLAGDPEASRVRAELTASLRGLLTFFSHPEENSLERFERIASEFYSETGMLAPGKSEPMDFGYQGRDEERRERYDEWVSERVERARNICPAKEPRQPVKARLL